MVPSVNAASTITAEISGQVNICNLSNPCSIATLEVTVSGPDPQDLTGTLLIHRPVPSPPEPCVASVTGSVSNLNAGDAPTATIQGTLHVAGLGTACVGGLQGSSVTLLVDSMFGTIQLTRVSSSGVTEFLASGTGFLIVTQTTTST